MSDPILEWLIEKENPSVRYFALRDLLDCPADDRELQTARRAIMRSVPVEKILAAQADEGYWAQSGWGYAPKYCGTDWTILILAELGADGRDKRIRRGVEYLLAHAQAAHGGFSAMANAQPSGALYCLNGNLVRALNALGYGADERVLRAVDWMSGAVFGENAQAHSGSGTSGPNFACAANGKLPCAWGAVKTLRAFASMPDALKTPRAKRAQDAACEFLLNGDLARANYPYTERVSGVWFKFGFPLGYTSDVLETVLALSEAGHARDARLKPALELVLSQRDAQGRWTLKNSLNGKMWIDLEEKNKPSKWITLRARCVLKAAGVQA